MWLSVYADLSLQSVSLRKKSLLIPLIIPLSMRPSERSRNSVRSLTQFRCPFARSPPLRSGTRRASRRRALDHRTGLMSTWKADSASYCSVKKLSE